MNSAPNFDMKNPREYPGFGNVPVAKGEVSTGHGMQSPRIVATGLPTVDRTVRVILKYR